MQVTKLLAVVVVLLFLLVHSGRREWLRLPSCEGLPGIAHSVLLYEPILSPPLCFVD